MIAEFMPLLHDSLAQFRVLLEFPSDQEESRLYASLSED
jgi:hypothetical protein